MGRPCPSLFVLPSPNLPSWASHARSFEDPSQSLGALLPSAWGRSHLPSSLHLEAAPWWLRPEHTHSGIRPASGHLGHLSCLPPNPSRPLHSGEGSSTRAHCPHFTLWWVPAITPPPSPELTSFFPRQNWVLGSWANREPLLLPGAPAPHPKPLAWPEPPSHPHSEKRPLGPGRPHHEGGSGWSLLVGAMVTLGPFPRALQCGAPLCWPSSVEQGWWPRMALGLGLQGSAGWNLRL